MEEVLGQQMRPPIKFADFLTDFKQALGINRMPTNEEDIKNELKLLDEATFKTTAENCSLSALSQLDDTPIAEYIPGFTELHRKYVTSIPGKNNQLQLFKKLLAFKAMEQRNPFKRSHESYRLLKLPPREDGQQEYVGTPLAFYNDLLITVRIYRPARATHVGRSLEKPVFAEEFQCLGSNLLTQLRDKIACICNGKRFFDISEHPHEPLPTKETDPGYFFITDTFYNDKRNPANADYSETIRNWAQRAAGFRNLQFKVAKMEETRFIDLTVSPEFPQLYQHHGNCEHVFTFSQVELLTPASAPWTLKQEQYPRLRSVNLYNNRVCHMCGSLHFTFIVEQSDRQLHDPAYLCSKCFYSFHYIDGKKIGDFKAYRVNDIELQVTSDIESNDDDISTEENQDS